MRSSSLFLFFFFNDTATTEIYTLSLHDALPIFPGAPGRSSAPFLAGCSAAGAWPHQSVWKSCSPSSKSFPTRFLAPRSEEHTSELQSRSDLVCRLLLEKKKKNTTIT